MYVHSETVADLEMAYALAVADETRDYRIDSAQNDESWASLVLDKERELFEDLADLIYDLDTSDAAAAAAYQTDAAADYVNAVMTWDADEDTAWSQYQLDLAITQQGLATSLSGADTVYATAIATLDRSWSLSENGAISTWEQAQVDAQEAYLIDVAEAERLFDLGSASTIQTNNVDEAFARKSYEISLAGIEQGYRNAIAARDRDRANALNAAQNAFDHSTIDLKFDLADDTIDSDQFSTQSADAETTLNDSVTNANDAYENDSTEAMFQRATSLVGAVIANEDLLKDARDTLASSDNAVKAGYAAAEAGHFIDFVDDQIAADGNFELSMASAEHAYVNGVALADAQAATDNDAALAVARGGAASARGVYEITLHNEHIAALEAVALSNPSHLADYQVAHAIARRDQTQAAINAIAVYHGELKDEDEIWTTALNDAEIAVTAAISAAELTNVNTIDQPWRTWSEDSAEATINFQLAVDTAAFEKQKSDALAESKKLRDTAVAAVDLNLGISTADQDLLDVLDDFPMDDVPHFWGNRLRTVDAQGNVVYETPSNSEAAKLRQAQNAVRRFNMAEAEINFAIEAGQATQQFLIDYATAETNLISSLNGLDGTFVGELTTADMVFLDSAIDAENQFVLSSKLADNDWTAAAGQAAIDLEAALGTSKIAESTAIASAEGAYQQAVAEDESTALAAAAAASGDPDDELPADIATARLAWMGIVRPAFEDLENGLSTADVNLKHATATALVNQEISQVQADFTFTNALLPVSKTKAVDSAAAFNAYDSSMMSLQNDLTYDTMLAQHAFEQQSAGLESTHDINVARSQQTYITLGVLGAANVASPKLNEETANSNLNKATGQAIANYDWSDEVAEALEDYMIAFGPVQVGLITSLANIEYTFASDSIEPTLDLTEDRTESDVALENAFATAQANYNITIEETFRDYLTADATGEVVAANALNASQNTPYTQFLADKAMAEQTWWNSQASKHETAVEDLNQGRLDFQTLEGNEKLSLTQSMNTANEALLLAIASANKVHDTTSINAISDSIVDLAPLSADYVRSQAGIERTFDIALANADHAFALDQNSAAHQDTVTSAAATRDASLHLAKDGFEATELSAETALQADLALADLTFENSVNSAETAYENDVNSAVTTSGSTIATALRDLRINESNQAADSAIDDADSYSAALQPIGQAGDSPWGIRAAATAAAEAVLISGLANSVRDIEIEVANADHASDLAILGAVEDLQTGVIEAEAGFDVAYAAALEVRANSEESAASNAQAAGLNVNDAVNENKSDPASSPIPDTGLPGTCDDNCDDDETSTDPVPPPPPPPVDPSLSVSGFEGKTKEEALRRIRAMKKRQLENEIRSLSSRWLPKHLQASWEQLKALADGKKLDLTPDDIHDILRLVRLLRKRRFGGDNSLLKPVNIDPLPGKDGKYGVTMTADEVKRLIGQVDPFDIADAINSEFEERMWLLPRMRAKLKHLNSLEVTAQVFSEPVDWAYTFGAILSDPSNPWNYAGLAPILPTGTRKLGSAKYLDEAADPNAIAKVMDELGTIGSNSTVRNPWDSIDRFRRGKHGLDELGDTIPIRGDGLGTVAFIEFGGKKVFGVNSTALVRDVDKNLGRMWRKRLGFNAGQAQSLFHAEAHSLMRAYQKAGGKMPSEMTLYVDRLTCGPCQGALPDLIREMGIKRLIVRTKSGRVGEIIGDTFRWLK